MIEITKDVTKEVTKDELEFYFYMNDKSGSFKTHLINAIMIADVENFLRLHEAYSEMCSVVWRYKNVPEYWEDLQSRASK